MQKSRKICWAVISSILLLTAIVIVSSWHNDLSAEEVSKKYLTENSKFTTIKNTKVHYQEKGKGPALVLIHGTASSSHTWKQWMDILSKDFRVIAPDLPGFGLTGPRADGKYAMEDMLEFIHEFVEKMGVDSIYLGGNSLGGLYTWKYTQQHPEVVKKMMVSNSLGYPSKLKKPIGFRLASSPLAPLLQKLTPRFLIAATLEKSFANPELVDDQMIDRYFELLLRQGNRVAYLSRMKQMSAIDTTEIATIKTPSLVMWGMMDQVVPAIDAFKFYRDLPISTLRLYPDIGHLPMEELPAASAQDLKDFLLQKIEEKKDLPLIPSDLSYNYASTENCG